MTKKIFFPLITFLFSYSLTYSTNWIITDSGISFTPATLTITAGDSVLFNLAGIHDAVEVDQATWNVNGNTPNGGFSLPNGGGQLLPAQLSNIGTYYYVCSPHANSGMKGTIVVQACVPPAMPVSISGSATICSGNPSQYSTALVSGATSYTWNLPGGWSGSSTSNHISVTPNTISGVLSVSAVNSCGTSASQTISITVNSAPTTPGSISGNNSVCAGSNPVYSISAVAGATSYAWQLPSGWSGTSTTVSINTTAGSTGGNISVSAINACGTSTAQSLSVSVTAIPAMPGSITGNSSVCTGVLNNYSIVAVSGATSYSWILPSGWTGSSSTTSIGGTPGNSGTISVTAINTCGTSSAQTLMVTVDAGIPPAPGTISGNGTICMNSNNTYSVSPVTGATFYTWILPSGWTGGSTSNSISATASATSGQVSVTAGNACGSSSASTLNVTVTTINSAPNMPGTISGNDSVCTGSTENYSIVAVSGATSYGWTLPTGWTGSSSGTNISATAGSTGGIVSVQAINSCGTSAAQTIQVEVGDLPIMPASISGSTTLCSGNSAIYYATPVTGASSYVWTLPIGWSGNSGVDSIQTTAGSSGIISVSSVNFCGASSAQTLSVTVNTAPSAPVTINGNALICTGSPSVYSVAPVTGATSYTWGFPSGWTASGTSNSINATPGNGGTISVISNNDCGSSSPVTMFISVISIPAQPGSISGNAMICEGTTGVYSVSPVSGASTYTWQAPSGWMGNGNNNIYSGTPGSSGNLSVTANNTCGSSPASTLNIMVHTVNTTLQMNGNSLTAVAAGGSYQWVTCPGFTPISGEVAQTFTPVSTGTYAAIISLAGCTDTSVCTLVTIVSNSSDTDSEHQMELFPNPSTGFIHLIIPQQNLRNTQVQIWSIDGKLRLQNAYSETIDLSNFPNGIYLIQVKNENRLYQKTVILQK